jgi:hypothetical protein
MHKLILRRQDKLDVPTSLGQNQFILSSKNKFVHNNNFKDYLYAAFLHIALNST